MTKISGLPSRQVWGFALDHRIPLNTQDHDRAGLNDSGMQASEYTLIIRAYRDLAPNHREKLWPRQKPALGDRRFLFFYTRI